MGRISTKAVVESLTKILADGASVSFYMFYGGTNFGFTAGSNDAGQGNFKPVVTSYDYDAPMDEAGDIVTEKYMAIRNVISKVDPTISK